MQRSSSHFQDPKRRESLAILLDYDFENPPVIPESVQKKKSSFAPHRLKSAHSTFDLKCPQSTARDSRSFVPSKSTSMSHLSMSSIPMTTPVARQSYIHPKNVPETPKVSTTGVEPRIIREKECIHASAKLVLSFLTDKNYPNSISLRSLLNPELHEILNIFSFLLSFIDPQLATEVCVKEDIPNVLALLNYPYTIKKSTISALNTPHNWPSILASIRFIVEVLEEVMPHDLGLDTLYPPASFSEEACSSEQFREDMIRNSQMFQCKDDPEVLESYRRNIDEHYVTTLSDLRSQREQLRKRLDELTRLNAEMNSSTFAIYESMFRDKCEEMFQKQQQLSSIQQQTRSNQDEKKRLNQELLLIQKRITEEDNKIESLTEQVQWQEINIDTAIEMKEDTTATRLEIDRQRTLISNYNDKIIELRMQHSKRMSKVRAGMSQVNISLKQITLSYQGCYDVAHELGVQFENANYEMMKSPEHLSVEIHRNLDILQQIKVMVNSSKSDFLQNEIEANHSIESLKNSVVTVGLEIKECKNEMKLLQEMNDELQEKKMNFQKEKSDKKIRMDQELYQLRRDCEESAALVVNLETERNTVIMSGREENEKFHVELNSLVAEIESVMDQIVSTSDERNAVLSLLEQVHGAYKDMYSRE